MNPFFGPTTGSLIPGMGMQPRKRSWQSRLYDRMMPDSQGMFAVDDNDKKALVKQGLLQLGIGLLQNNTLAGGLGQGLQGGLLSMQEGTHGLRNDRYQQAMMQRTMAGMDRNNRLESLQGELVGPDGRIDEAKFREFATMDPQGAKAFRDAIDPQTRWQLGRVGDGAGGEVDVLFDPMDPSKMRTLDGQALATPQQQAPIGGAAGSLMGNALHGAVEQVESGGNPLAVSPAGAVGPMQTMPDTLRDPGFGVAPARNGSVDEQRRVGQQYIDAMVQKYGPVGGLAAYNWGPGNWEAALQRSGGDPQRALQLAPKETQDYVPKVMAQMGRAPGIVPPRIGTRPKADKQGPVILTPEEVASMGLPKGTVAERGPNGVQVLHKPSDRGPEVDDGMSPGERKDVRKDLYGVRQALVNFQNLDKALAAVPQSGALDPESKGRLGTSYNNARAALRLVYNTGVLQPGELPMLESALRDPSGYTVMLDPRLRGQMRGQLDELYRALNSQTQLLTETYPGMFKPERMKEGGDLLREARNAVMNGKDKEAVRQRLIEKGYPNLAKVL